MKTWRIFVAIIAVGIIVEFLTPILSAKTGIFIPLVQNNCGAVPVFIQDIITVESSPDPRYWRGFITCGVSGLAFLLMPGFIKIFHWLYRFVHPKKNGSKSIPE